MPKPTKSKSDLNPMETLRRFILRNPDLSRDEVAERVKDVAASTVGTVHYHTHAALKSLAALGLYSHGGSSARERFSDEIVVEKRKPTKAKRTKATK